MPSRSVGLAISEVTMRTHYPLSALALILIVLFVLAGHLDAATVGDFTVPDDAVWFGVGPGGCSPLPLHASHWPAFAVAGRSDPELWAFGVWSIGSEPPTVTQRTMSCKMSDSRLKPVTARMTGRSISSAPCTCFGSPIRSIYRSSPNLSRYIYVAGYPPLC
jgi:hypothetical protein